MWSPHSYKKLAKKNQLSEDTINSVIERVKIIGESDSPAIILTLGHLANRVKIKYEYLKETVERNSTERYRTFYIRKRSGGIREIYVPDYPLALTQKWINAHILSNVSVHPSSYAFAPGSSIQKCAAKHCAARWLIKLDIANFFESITEIQVYRVFESIGYSPLVSFELARIVTVDSENYSNPTWKVWKTNDEIPNYSSKTLGFLPQGAPTSPMLSNLVMKEMDESICNLAHRHNLEFTRYSDDMTFSTSSKKFSRKKANYLISSVSKILSEKGFQLQTKKTNVIPPGANKIVLGLNVNEEKPKLRKEFKENLKFHLFYLSKNGAVCHQNVRQFKTLIGMKKHIRGLINYSKTIEPDFSEKMLKEFNDIDWPV